MKLPILLFLFIFVIFKQTTVVESVIQKQDAYLDDDFKRFTYFFASSPSANFLSRIVHSDESRFMQTRSRIGIMSKTVDKAYSINQISNNILRVYMSILLLLLLPLFSYIGTFGIARKHIALTLSSIIAYFTLLIVFFLTNGIFNIGFVTSLPIVVASLVFNLATSDYTTGKLYKYIRYIFCFIVSKFVYDVMTSLGVDRTKTYDYGLSGFIYINMFSGSHYIVLKIVHLLVLSLLSILIFKMFARFFSNDTLKSNRVIKTNKYILSALCSLPIATGFTQIFYLMTNTINPIDPSIFFMIPSSINFNSISTMFSLAIWVITTFAMAYLSDVVEKDYNNVLNKIPTKLSEFL